MIADKRGGGLERGEVRTGAGLGEGEGGELLAAGEEREQPLLLFRRAESANGINGADATVDRSEPSDSGIDGGHAGEEWGEASKRRSRAAEFRRDEQTPVAGLGQFLQSGIGDFVVFVEQSLFLDTP